MEVVALSGGKDSTAMALRLNEIEPNGERIYLITPTGDELPPMQAHWRKLERRLDMKLTIPKAPTLRELIDKQKALPNPRMRWCTRMIKIQPTIAWIKNQTDIVTLCVGLRADEEERRGLYDDSVETRFPLREWNWGLTEVLEYLRSQQICIPQRTDCARCPFQRLGEWYHLWRDYPDIYESAVQDEDKVGATYRMPERDTWSQDLRGLRAEFERGRIPRGTDIQQDLFGEIQACRVCRM